MPTNSDIDFLLGIVREPKRPGKKVSTTFVKRRKSYFPYKKKYPLKPELFDIDLMKMETVGGSFCGCGRRKSGESICIGCWNTELDDV